MRRIFGMSAAFMGALLLGLSARSVQAQELHVNVPFSFVVNGQTLPAGKYDVRPAGMDPSVIAIREVNGNAGVYVLTMTAVGHDPAGNTPALTFVPYEHQHRLTGIWQSDLDGRTLPKT